MIPILFDALPARDVNLEVLFIGDFDDGQKNISELMNTDQDHKMSQEYLNHKVFGDLDYMMEFYDSISMNCFLFSPMETRCVANYASYL